LEGDKVLPEDLNHVSRPSQPFTNPAYEYLSCMHAQSHTLQ